MKLAINARKNKKMDEEWNNDLVSEVYNALSDIVFKHQDITPEDMEEAVEWFMIHFYDDKELDEDLEDDVDHMEDVTNFDDNMVDDLEDNKACLETEVKEVKKDYKQYFEESKKLREADYNFDYDKYFLDEETVKSLVDDMMYDGINPWEDQSQIKDYLKDECGYDERDIPGITKCIKKYIHENEQSATLWDAVYSDVTPIVTGDHSIKLLGGPKLKNQQHNVEDAIVTETDGFTLKGNAEEDFDHDKEVAEYFKLDTVGPYFTNENAAYKYEFKIVIPEDKQLMDVYDYLEEVNAE